MIEGKLEVASAILVGAIGTIPNDPGTFCVCHTELAACPLRCVFDLIESNHEVYGANGEGL